MCKLLLVQHSILHNRIHGWENASWYRRDSLGSKLKVEIIGIWSNGWMWWEQQTFLLGISVRDVPVQGGKRVLNLLASMYDGCHEGQKDRLLHTAAEA